MVVVSESKTKANNRLGFLRLKKLSGVSAGIILLVILAIVFVLSFAWGRYPISPINVVQILAYHIQQLLADLLVHLHLMNAAQSLPIHQTWPEIMNTVVIQIRLPRIVAAVLIGGSLATAGVSFQGLFRNPLVSPDILGVSAGASFGAAIGILMGGNRFVIQGMAFGIAMIAVAASYGVSRVVRGNPTLSLILAGMAMGSLFGAFVSMAKLVADPTNQLPTITYWLMGSLSGLSLHDLLFASIPMIIGITILVLIRWRFNVLAMGEEEAMALGINTGRLRIVIVLCCTVMTAAAVSISGTIGWVGLVMPHIGRMLVGPDHKKLIPVTLLLGAVFLLIIDDIARNIALVEIPIGILTAIIGVPFFLYLLSRGTKGWA